jgi:hypothetical protein
VGAAANPADRSAGAASSWSAFTAEARIRFCRNALMIRSVAAAVAAAVAAPIEAGSNVVGSEAERPYLAVTARLKFMDCPSRYHEVAKSFARRRRAEVA